MLFDNVSIDRNADRLEITITACDEINYVGVAMFMLVGSLFLAGGLFVLFFDPRLSASGMIAICGWLCAAAILVLGGALGIVWRSTGSERWTIDAEAVRYERWFGETRVKYRRVPASVIDSIALEERQVSSRSGYRVYRKPVLTTGGRRLRGWGNLHAYDSAKVSTALELASQDFGYRRQR
jgi:hypothetical protein